MSGVKIQINSLEALERLIGGDTELEIELRGAIVQEFTKRHLKGIATDVIISNAEYEARNYIRENYLTLANYKTKEYASQPNFRDEIQKQIQSFFSTEVNKAIREYNESDETILMIKKRIDDKVIATAARIEEELSDVILSKRIDALVDKKLKEKLGLI